MSTTGDGSLPVRDRMALIYHEREEYKRAKELDASTAAAGARVANAEADESASATSGKVGAATEGDSDESPRAPGVAFDAAHALRHIKHCDRAFDGVDEDGQPVKPSKEFAYQQVRLLALELLELIP